MKTKNTIIVTTVIFNFFSFLLPVLTSSGWRAAGSESLAQAGSLDLSFSSDGKDTLAIGSFGSDFGRSVAIQSDGKIVVAGESSNGTSFDFAVVRYKSDGTLDNSFSSDGKVTTGIVDDDKAYSVAIQSNGKIVVAGWSGNGPDYNFALARYDSTGTLDNTFGVGGIVTTDFGGNSDQAHSVAIQSDGKIVAAGVWIDDTNPNVAYSEFALARYDSTGTLDNTFGSGGKVTTSIGSGNDHGYSVAIQNDGKIIVAGFAQDTNTVFVQDFALVRYKSDGSLDSTFSTDGKVKTDMEGFDDEAKSVIIQSDGKIVVVGNSYNSFNFISSHLVCYDSTGNLDNTFGTGGIVTNNGMAVGYEANSVALQSDGKIVVAGIGKINLGDFAIVRYNTNGSVDSNFDSDGMVTTDIIGSSADMGYSVAIQSDDKIVVAGESNGMFAVARYDCGAISTGMDDVGNGSKQVSVYPNPFTHSTTIKITNKEQGIRNYELRVYDVLGKEVKKLIINSSADGTLINSQDLPGGVYIYKVENEKKIIANGKLIIQ